MAGYRVVTEDGKVVLDLTTYEGAVRYWESCGGTYEDEMGEHLIFVEESE